MTSVAETSHRSDQSGSPIIRPTINLGKVFFYVATVVLIALVYFKFSELKFIAQFFSTSNLVVISTIILSQFMANWFVALNYEMVLRMKDTLVPVNRLFPVTFIIQFITQILPTAGISGQVFLIYYLRRYKLSFGQGMARAILEVLTLYSAYSILFIIALPLLFQSHIIESVPSIVFFIYAFIFFACIFLFFLFAFQKKRRIKWVSRVVDAIQHFFEKNPRLERFRQTKLVLNHKGHLNEMLDQFRESLDFDFLRRRKRQLGVAISWQFMFLIANVFTLFFISIAMGTPLPFGIAFIVYTLSKLVSMTSVVPGALVIFEAAMTLVLASFGIEWGEAIALTVLFRAFTFWFPMPIGFVLYNIYMRRLSQNGHE